MVIKLGAKPLADFTSPLEMLSDCHRRIESFLSILQSVARLGGAQLDLEHRAALEAALTYFRSSAPKHTADEEDSLFPRMRASADTDAEVAAAIAEIDALEADHERAEQMHARVDELGCSWMASGTLVPDLAAELASLLDELAATYGRHIALEDERIFPLAGRTLPADQLQQVGREMAGRRGHDVPPGA